MYRRVGWGYLFYTLRQFGRVCLFGPRVRGRISCHHGRRDGRGAYRVTRDHRFLARRGVIHLGNTRGVHIGGCARGCARCRARGHRCGVFTMRMGNGLLIMRARGLRHYGLAPTLNSISIVRIVRGRGHRGPHDGCRCCGCGR